MENLLALSNTDKTQPDNSAIGLATELDRFLSGKENPTGIKKITGFHPSYGYSCKRRWVLSFLGAPYERAFTPRTQRIFDNGHGVHARWREYFDQMGILEQAEVPVNVSDPVPIRGHADGILDWGGRKLYELKSINTQRFEWRRAYKKPDDKTYAQAQLYLFCLDLEDGLVIYENKDNQEVLIFPIQKDEKLIQKELKRYTKIYEMVQEEKVPPRPYKRDSRQCGECDLIKYCWDTLDE